MVMKKTKEDLRDENFEEKIEPEQRPEGPKSDLKEEDLKHFGFKPETEAVPQTEEKLEEKNQPIRKEDFPSLLNKEEK